MSSIRLGDVVKVHHGWAFPGPGFGTDPELPQLVTPGNFEPGGDFVRKVKSFSGEFPSSFIFEPGDLIISMTDLSKEGATLGKPAIVPNGGTYLHNQRIGKVEILDRSVLDKQYLKAIFLTDAFHRQILSTATGSTVRHTSPGRIYEFCFSLPELNLQRAIGQVLGALDDKIAANRRVVTASDDLRLQLWKRACASDSNEVPLSSLARFVNGRAFTKEASGTGRVVIRIAELNSGIGASTVRNDIEVADDHVARHGDLLLAWSGSLTSARWFREEAIVNQHIFKVVPNNISDMWAVASAVDSKMATFREIAQDKATTMGHIRRSDLDQFVGWPVISSELSGAGQNLWSCALSAEVANEALARTRDELLPLLMEGRITVKDAERTAEAVL